jgi:hypothetical protein
MNVCNPFGGYRVMSDRRHSAGSLEVYAMSGQPRTKRSDRPPCPRCKAAQMAEILTITPLLHEPGLIAFECTDCGYISSMIISPDDRS